MLFGIGKRLLVGTPMQSDRLGHTLLPKKIALPVFASDALSSVAYAPDEIFLTLSTAGLAAYTYSWKIGLVVVAVMLTVVASYRQNVHAYPSGGGDYEVATVNLGSKFGLTVAAALLVDYVLTVAVSVSSGVQNASSKLGFVHGNEALVAVGLVLLLTAVNLRGVKESGAAFAFPTYGFMVSIVGMTLFGLARYFFGHLPHASSAGYTIRPDHGFAFTGFAAGFLLLRTFSSGCAALTGVEAISNGVPAFKKPKSKNAATTLLLMGTIAVTMLMGILTLGHLTQLRFAESPADQLLKNGIPVGPGYNQPTVISQLSDAVFTGPTHFLSAVVVAFTGVILILAANTAFNGFPVLGSILARDGYLPRQLHTRGDRLAYSNGIILLAGFAMALIVAFDAQVTRLIQLYIVGVFISFTLSQTGMIRHWTRLLRSGDVPSEDVARMKRSRVINSIGLGMTGTVLVIVLITKFVRGAWIALAAMTVLFLLMRGIRRHYDRVREELVPAEDLIAQPSRNHAIVLVSKIHAPTLRALSYAKATRPHDLTALTVGVDPEDTQALHAEWDRRGIDVPLTVIDSPYREITRPILDYVRRIRRESPRDVVTVFIPEYVVGRWWEQLLHNQSALRLKGRLLFQPGVMVTSVPYQLRSSDRRRDDDNPGQFRRPV